MLGHHWEKAEATVVARTVRAQPAGHRPHYDFVVDVQLMSGPPLRMTIQDGPDGDFDDPAVGDVLGVLYDPKHQHVKWDLTDPWLLDAAADRRAARETFSITAMAPPGAFPGSFPGGHGPGMDGFNGNVQYLTGDAASELLGNLFGTGGAETIAALRARAAEHADPAERLSRLRALLDSGVLNEAEYGAQRQKIIDGI